MIKKNAMILLPTLCFALLLAACEKIEPQDLPGDRAEFAETMDTIPLEYGKFVSAVPLSQFVQILWFEQPDSSIVAVRVNVSQGTISKRVITFERE